MLGRHPAYASAAYADAILATRPVGFWRLDERTGTTARDLTRTNNGTYTGSPTLGKPSPTRDGATIGLNGSSQYVVITDLSAYSPVTTGQMSWMFWAKATSTTTNHVIAKGAGSGSWEWTIMRGLSPLFTNGTGFVAQMWQSGGTSYAVVSSGSGSVENNTWAHVAVTLKQGTELVIYINGRQMGRSTSFSGSQVDGTSAVNIGRRPDNTRYFPGDVGDVAIWNRQLSAGEVLALYEEAIR